MKPQKVELTYKTVVFIAVFIVALLLLWAIRDIIILLFVCFVLMEALNPTVSKLERLRIPRPLAIFILYIVIISFFSFVLAGIIPILIDQTNGLVKSLPEIINNFKLFGLSAIDLSSQLKIIETIPSEIAKTAFSIFSNLLTGVFILVVTFYLLLERKHLDTHSYNVGGSKARKLAKEIFNSLETRLGMWVNGELLLMTIVGALCYVGYLFLGLNFALPLALMAGLLEIIPNIGPILTTIVAAIVGLSISPLTALLVIIWGIIVQQLENTYIVPKIMKEAVGINPIITIIAVATGGKLGGVAGALLAVPIYLTFETIISKIIESRK